MFVYDYVTRTSMLARHDILVLQTSTLTWEGVGGREGAVKYCLSFRELKERRKEGI